MGFSTLERTVVRLAAAAVALRILFSSHAAFATDPDRVEWSPDWPRVRLVEGLDIIASTAGSYAMTTYWTPPSSASWRGPILFDAAVRDAFRGRSLATQSTASTLSDNLYFGSVIVPYLVDVYVVAL
jgi:hypothetical protein